MAARKKTQRKRARRARAKPAARAAKSKRAKPEPKARAQKPPAKARRARSRAKPTGSRAQPSPARSETKPAPPPRTALSLAVLASQPVRVGVVTHWFARARVAALALEAPLAPGERIHVRGSTSDFLASAASLRVRGPLVTLALPERARPGDAVYALRAPA